MNLCRIANKYRVTALLWFATLLLILLVLMRPGISAEELLDFKSPEQQQFFEKLLNEYRCLKCQNQTIADSRADLASDLRREIYTMVIEGKEQSEITEYLVQRYGDFVLYRPRWQLNTLLLWLGPPLLLVLALLTAWLVSRKQQRSNSAVNNSDNSTARQVNESVVRQTEIEKARSLLNQ